MDNQQQQFALVEDEASSSTNGIPSSSSSSPSPPPPYKPAEIQSKFQKLDQLLEKTAIYTQFISEKFKQTTVYSIVPNGTSSAAAPTQSDPPDGEKSTKKKKKKDRANKRTLQQKLDEINPTKLPTSVSQPQLVTGGILRDYQLVGVNWMIGLWENGMNGILADEMGLGKTIMVIAFLSHLWEKGVKGPFLVVAPLTTLQNWINEFKKWAPTIPVMMYHDNKDGRATLRDKLDKLENKRRKLNSDIHKDSNGSEDGSEDGLVELSKFENKGVLPVIITSYDIAINDRKYLQKYKWKYLVVDEAHRLKNFNCKLICELRLLQTDNRLLLTGTPLQNNLTELWSLLNFILPDVFDDLNNFQRWFDFTEVLEGSEHNGLINGEDHISPHQQLVTKLHDILRPFLLRRLKTDVELAIPKKKEMVIYCSFTQSQRAFYNAVRSKDLGKHSMRLSNIVMHLRKVCNHPFLFDPLITRKYLDPSYQSDSDEENSEAEIGNGDKPRLRNRPRRDYSEEYDEYEFDRMIDEFEEDAGVTNGRHDGDQVSNGGQKMASKKSADPRSAYNLYLRDQFAKLREHNNGEPTTVGDVARSWTMLPEVEKQKYYIQYEKQLEMFAEIGNPYKDEDPEKYMKSMLASCGKLQLLEKMLPVLQRDGHKCLIFSQMTRLLDILEDYLELKGYAYCRIDGSVKLQERQAQIESFNTDPNVFIFLLSTRAGGVGINLTSADTVIIYDSDWNPQMDLQAQDRCHRIGQYRPVVVYRLCVANSIESSILKRAKSKLRLENLVIKKGNFKFENNNTPQIRRFTVADLQEIMELEQSDGAIGTETDGAIKDEDLQLVLDRSKCFEVLDKKESISANASEAQGFEVLEEITAEF